MIILGRRKSRTIKSKSWSTGSEKAFTENLSPAREAGTKMLKLKDKLFNISESYNAYLSVPGTIKMVEIIKSNYYPV